MSEALCTLRAEPLRRFKPYAAYKDSGVEWLGEVPAHWEVKPLKRAIRQGSADGSLIKGRMHQEPGEGLFPGFSASGQDIWVEDAQHDHAGIVLSAVGARCGKTFKADGRWTAVANTHVIFAHHGHDRDFLWYLTNDERFWDRGGTAQPFVRVSSTLQRAWCFPSLPEQRAIAAFLDRETARIDALVAKKERLIELLQEKRTALVTRAVTKGLDPTVPMKDSGVEWLAEIPAHWEVKPVAAMAESLVGFPFPSEEFSFDEGTRLVRGDNVTTESLRWGDKTRAWLKPAPHPRYYLMADDIVIGMDGSKVGRNYAMVRQEDLPLLLVQRVTRLRSRTSIVPAFLFWSIAGPRFHAHVDTCKSDPAIPHITLKNIESFSIAVPPDSEQVAIVDHLQTVGGKLTSLLERACDAVDRLKEFRTALISAAVTGKIDVRVGAA